MQANDIVIPWYLVLSNAEGTFGEFVVSVAC